MEHNLGDARLLDGDLVGVVQMIDAARQALAPLPGPACSRREDRAEVACRPVGAATL